MIFQMKKFGTILSTRSLGKQVYASLYNNILHCDELLILDFDGIDAVTNSFADEVFGRLAEQIGLSELQKRTTFRNIDRISAISVRVAIDARSKELTACR